jgi:transcriptional regulator with XRE-family HTH domain
VPDQPIGERIAIYRNRRGISQVVLAGLVGRSESWLSQVERGVRGVDRMSVIIDIAKALRIDVAELVGQPFSLGPADGVHDYAKAAAIRVALTDLREIGPEAADTSASDIDALEGAIANLQETYQAAQYSAAGDLVPVLIRRARQAVSATRGSERQRAVRLLATVYAASAALLSRVGETSLAWVAADRAVSTAQSADAPELVAAGLYRLAQALLRSGEIDDAHRVATAAAADITALARVSPAAASLQGALLLTAAIAAARRDDHRENLQLLRLAGVLAAGVGDRRNDFYTAFGPTNVALHSTSSAVELGDPLDAIRQAERVDIDSFPRHMAGRRSQLHLEVAWAYSQQHNTPAAVLSLIEADRLAPEVLHYNVTAREVLRSCLRHEKRTAFPGLRPLAQRAGITG